VLLFPASLSGLPSGNVFTGAGTVVIGVCPEYNPLLSNSYLSVHLLAAEFQRWGIALMDAFSFV
jgi:hypothetical protein